MQIVFTLPMRNSHLSKKQRLGYGFSISFALQIPLIPIEEFDSANDEGAHLTSSMRFLKRKIFAYEIDERPQFGSDVPSRGP